MSAPMPQGGVVNMHGQMVVHPHPTVVVHQSGHPSAVHLSPVPVVSPVASQHPPQMTFDQHGVPIQHQTQSVPILPPPPPQVVVNQHHAQGISVQHQAAQSSVVSPVTIVSQPAMTVQNQAQNVASSHPQMTIVDQYGVPIQTHVQQTSSPVVNLQGVPVQTVSQHAPASQGMLVTQQSLSVQPQVQRSSTYQHSYSVSAGAVPVQSSPQLQTVYVSQHGAPPVQIRPVQTQPQPSLQTQPQPSLHTQPQPSLQTQPQPSLQTQPQPSLQTQPQPSPQTQPQPSLQTQPQPSLQTQPHLSLQTQAHMTISNVGIQQSPGPVPMSSPAQQLQHHSQVQSQAQQSPQHTVPQQQSNIPSFAPDHGQRDQPQVSQFTGQAQQQQDPLQHEQTPARNVEVVRVDFIGPDEQAPQSQIESLASPQHPKEM